MAALVPGLLIQGGLAAPAQSAAPWSDAQVLAELQRLGVQVESRPHCGLPGQLATYNMGLDQLCLAEELRARPLEYSKVLHHELVHVAQDCLDGLTTPTSVSLAQGLRGQGGLSGEQVNGFLLQALRHQGNLNHVVATTAALPIDSRQREMEAYALQADQRLVQRLLQVSCRPLKAG